MNGKTVNLLTHELDRVQRAKAKHEKGTCVTGGILEKIVEKKDHPAREALIWNNLFFGLSRRKRVKMRPDWEAGNSPFFPVSYTHLVMLVWFLAPVWPR